MTSDLRLTKRRAFTLLEVILALSLSALVVIAVVGAVDFHARLLDSGQAEVEESQLARALLRRIADDLRCAVRYDPIDAEKMLEGVDMSAASLAAAAGDLGLADEDMEAIDDLTSAATTDIATSTAVPSVPGFYGNACEIQFDTSRMPRGDQYAGMLSADGQTAVVDVVSDVKTVAYYVLGSPIAGASYGGNVDANAAGLYRRELDRATTVYAADQGGLSDIENELLPIAPEVAAVQFLYYDGTEVVEEWDSDERGGLPLAVEITLWIVPKRLRPVAEANSRYSALMADTEPITDENCRVFRLVVHLPAAEATTQDGGLEAMDEETDTETTDETDETGGTGSTFGGAAAGGGAAGGGGGAPAGGGGGR